MSNKLKKIIYGCMLMIGILVKAIPAFADTIGNTGGTGAGGLSGSNSYTFNYIYDPVTDAIELNVVISQPLIEFGNTRSHTFTSMSDQITLHTRYPHLGASLESAITAMCQRGGYSLSHAYVRQALNNIGYYDSGNGIWRSAGGYLTYVSAVRVRPKIHTIVYQANGGSSAPGNQTKVEGSLIRLSSQRPIREGYSFLYWNSRIGHYGPGSNYGYDQDGGTMIMTAEWVDNIAPSCSLFSATPSSWSAGNGTVTFRVRDTGSGIKRVELQKYSNLTRRWSVVASWNGGNTRNDFSKIYTESGEGVFQYKLIILDAAGNQTVKTSNSIYLDHSNPKIIKTGNVNNDWTNIAPNISARATDYFQGTTISASGIQSMEIKEAANVILRRTNNISFTLTNAYEGERTFTIQAKDKVGHIATKTVTTRYDAMKPVIEVTEETEQVLRQNSQFVYLNSDSLSLHIDDESSRNSRHPNKTSGLKNVIMYKVKGSDRIVISEAGATFANPDTHSCYDLHYNIQPEDQADYYMVVATDFAGNTATKKFVDRNSVLRRFHTSIDRSSYD